MALGIKVRTGKAILVLLGGPAVAPTVVAKAMAQVAFTFEEGAVFHAAAQMSLARARTHVERAEARFTELAQREIHARAAGLRGPRTKRKRRLPPGQGWIDAAAIGAKG